MMKLHGEYGPNALDDGYIPGAWDEVRRAVMDGHISPQAYEVLREALGDAVTPRPAKKEET
jgi:hypothetical protein